MRPSRDNRSDTGLWEPYVPGVGAPWNLRRVVHLHRRAGFAATWDELGRDLKDGPEASIGRLLEGQARAYGVPADFADVAGRLADLALAAPSRIDSRAGGSTVCSAGQTRSPSDLR